MIPRVAARNFPQMAAMQSQAGFNFDGGVPGSIDWHSEPRLNGKHDGKSSSEHLRAGVQEPHSAGGGTSVEGRRHAASRGQRRRGRPGNQNHFRAPADVPRPCMAEIRGGFLNTELWSELSERAVDRNRVQAGARDGTSRHRRPGIYGRADSRTGAAGQAVCRCPGALHALRGQQHRAYY